MAKKKVNQDEAVTKAVKAYRSAVAKHRKAVAKQAKKGKK